MRRLRWMLIAILMGATVCCCAVPGVDLPETAFNEADLPVNLALPAPPRIPDLAPVVVPIVALPTLPLFCADCRVSRLALAPAVLPTQHHPHSLQVLLCTFLI